MTIIVAAPLSVPAFFNKSYRVVLLFSYILVLRLLIGTIVALCSSSGGSSSECYVPYCSTWLKSRIPPPTPPFPPLSPCGYHTIACNLNYLCMYLRPIEHVVKWTQT